MSNKIKGVEIFSAGKWNGDEYSVDDLNAMVQAFDENKEGYTPYLKLGHDDDQKLLQKDGLPAAGWIDRVYVKGEKLLADFSDIPNKIYDLIRKKAYRKVSSEIYWNLEIGKKKYKRFLGAVALLGANTPGVMNLKDILSLYGLKNLNEGVTYASIKSYASSEENLEPKVYEKNMGEIKVEPTQKEKELQSELEKLKGEVKKFSSLESDKQKLEKELADVRKEQAEKLKEAHDKEVKAFVSELKSEKLISKAMEPMVYGLLKEDKKEYSIKHDEKTEKKYSKNDLLKSILNLSKEAAKVNFTESSSAGENKDKGLSEQDKLDKEIKAYAKENGVGYGQAYSAVLKQKEIKEV